MARTCCVEQLLRGDTCTSNPVVDRRTAAAGVSARTEVSLSQIKITRSQAKASPTLARRHHMKTPRKLTFSFWLTLITALASVDSVKAGGGVDPNFHAPFFANADMPGRASLLPDGRDVLYFNVSTLTDQPTGTFCTIFSENFDAVAPPALPAGWEAFNAQGPAPLWVTSSEIPDTAPNAAFVDDPGTISDKLLDTPPVAITSGTAQVTFRNYYDLESTFDGGVLEIAIVGGAFTDIITAGGSFVAGGYNATIDTQFGSPIAGRQAWSGNSGGYITTIVNLGPNVAGQTVILRFRMASDISAAAFGWLIDTITVTDACPSPTPTATPTATPTGTPPVITSPLIAYRVKDQLFTYQFEAEGATTLDVSNLPPGLTFNTSLAAIIGTPTEAGTFQVGLSASNTAGTTTATLSITVPPAPPSGPIIISSTAATGRTGQFFSFHVITTGSSPSERLRASGLPPGLAADPVSGLIFGTPTSDASSAVTLTVTDGNLTTTSILQLTFTSDPALPVIIGPDRAALTPGEFFSHMINAPSTADPSDPTIFTYIGTDGIAHQEASCAGLPAGLCFDGIDTISGIYTGSQLASAKGGARQPELAGGALLGSVQLFATNSHGTSTFQLLFLPAPSGVVNISTRLLVGTGDNRLIGGFIIQGTAPKVVIIRALGPSTGVPGALQDPTLELHDSADNVVSNDDWRTDPTQEQFIIGTTIPPTDDRESAIVAGLDPGNYTAIVTDKNGATGIALVEVYDLGTGSIDISGNARLANISTRGFVDTGDNVMIGGFIIRPQAPATSTTVVIRAIGPSLTAFGLPNALLDPLLELHDGNGSLIASNDDWRSTQEQQIIDTGLPPTDDRESAIVADLAAGNYTAIVSGKDNTTGLALVEVYALQ
jgi:Putative Ig domain